MLLKIKRSQKSTMMGTAVFTLDFRAEVSKDERALIDRYKLGKMIVYSSDTFQQSLATVRAAGTGQVGFLRGAASLASAILFNLKITVNDLVNGKHVEMKDLDELISAEGQVVQACNNLKNYLEAAVSFDGRELELEI